MDYDVKFKSMETALDNLNSTIKSLDNYTHRLDDVKSTLGLFTSLLGFRRNVDTRINSVAQLSAATRRTWDCLNNTRIAYFTHEQTAYQLLSGDYSFEIGDGLTPVIVPTEGSSSKSNWWELLLGFSTSTLIGLAQSLTSLPKTATQWLNEYMQRYIKPDSLSDNKVDFNIGKGAQSGEDVVTGGKMGEQSSDDLGQMQNKDQENALLEKMNDKNVIGLKQPGSGPCVMYSVTMLLRRKQILEGKEPSIVYEDVYKENEYSDYGKWKENMCEYEMQTIRFPSSPRETVIELLENNPAGVVAYFHASEHQQHAVLITDYDPVTDTLYSSDPATGNGRENLESTFLTTQVFGGQDAWNYINKFYY